MQLIIQYTYSQQNSNVGISCTFIRPRLNSALLLLHALSSFIHPWYNFRRFQEKEGQRVQRMRFGYNYGCVRIAIKVAITSVIGQNQSLQNSAFSFQEQQCRVVVAWLRSCDTLLQLQCSIDIIIQDLRLQPAYSYPPASTLVNYANQYRSVWR